LDFARKDFANFAFLPGSVNVKILNFTEKGEKPKLEKSCVGEIPSLQIDLGFGPQRLRGIPILLFSLVP